jgi:hypothetical protein
MIGGALISGGFAMTWAYAGVRRILWMFSTVFVLQFPANTVLQMFLGARHTLNGQEMEYKLRVHGIIEIVLIVIGYALFLLFFNRERARFFRTQTEVRVAGEIHRSLVPTRHETIGNVELFGTSIPRQRSGGRFIRYRPERWSLGTLMWLMCRARRGFGDPHVHDQEHGTHAIDQTEEAGGFAERSQRRDAALHLACQLSYVCIRGRQWDGSSELCPRRAFAHPAYQAQTKTIIEHSDSNLPIGLFKSQNFTVSQLSLQRGDLLAVITDGFTEVFDSKEKEIGMEQFKAMLLLSAERSLPEIYRGLRAETMKFGKQTDDQTMLLIRRLG